MDQATKDKLAINVSNSWKMWSNHVMVIAGAVFAIYLRLRPDQQQTLVDHLPVPPWLLPIVASVIGIAVRLWPQRSISAPVAAAKSADPGPTAPAPLSLRDPLTPGAPPAP